MRFRDLPLIAETEKYGTTAYAYLAGGRRSMPSASAMATARGYYARGLAGIALCGLHRLGRTVDYYDTWKNASICWTAARCLPSVPPEHLMWVFGVKSRAEAMKARRLSADGTRRR